MTLSPIRLLLVVLLAGLSGWLVFDQVLQQRNTARSERDAAQNEAAGLREAARINGERLATAAANDTKNTQELSDALKNNQDLRRAVDDRDQRLRIKASCPAAGHVPTDPSAGGLADGGTAELSADARPDYFTLLDQLALSKQMILGLQAHVRSFCTTQPTTGTAP
ncbi:lysis system i-spanin subunit Rz [Pseudomonas sp. GTC 16482]|uniref:lysis system i-spanin subunit Rz n=1 Tax=Pseudomonas sp. GTC 16482 TaxID=1661693 RepID=UPI000761C26C|nr:lysis system i-spanin subunit Rz [Pseudomonas sp. GTC 16482]